MDIFTAYMQAQFNDDQRLSADAVSVLTCLCEQLIQDAE